MGTTEPDMRSLEVLTWLRLCLWQPVTPVHLHNAKAHPGGSVSKHIIILVSLSMDLSRGRHLRRPSLPPISRGSFLPYIVTAHEHHPRRATPFPYGRGVYPYRLPDACARPVIFCCFRLGVNPV